MSESPAPRPDPENPKRRNFLIGMITLMGAMIAFVLGGSGVSYFFPPLGAAKRKAG